MKGMTLMINTGEQRMFRILAVLTQVLKLVHMHT